MSFNSDFWIAVGAAAPVIALSTVVTANDTLSQLRKVQGKEDRRPSRQREIRRLALRAWFVYLLNGTNLAFQAVALLSALNSIANQQDFYYKVFFIWVETGGIIALGVTALIDVDIRLDTDEAADDLKTNYQKYRRVVKANIRRGGRRQAPR
jgi:hypothetical protein